MSSGSTFRHPFPVDSGLDEARMIELVERHWFLNRTACNPRTDEFVSFLAKSLDADVIEARSGEECLTWTVPKRWNVRSAKLRGPGGEIIADFDHHPLHLWTHSMPIETSIQLDDLLASHLHSDPDRPDEIPYHYRNGFQFDAEDWGFSLPHRVVETLEDGVYEVEIDADLDQNGTVKVVDAFLPGERAETIFFAAHTCHPGLVSDGIANIAVAAELYHWLSAQENRKYSYRFLFGPEYFGAAVYLDRAPAERIENLHYGYYLDMLSNHEPLGYQHTFEGDTLIDEVTENVLRSHVENHLERPYRQLWGNDETFYEGPGFRIPVIGLGRGMHREYHYHTDDISTMNVYHMVESFWVLQRIIEVLETDVVPTPTYTGPLYQSRYGLYIDPTREPDAARHLEEIQILMDGKRSCLDIALELGIDFYSVRTTLEMFHNHELVMLDSEGPSNPGDPGGGTGE